MTKYNLQNKLPASSSRYFGSLKYFPVAIAVAFSIQSCGGGGSGDSGISGDSPSVIEVETDAGVDSSLIVTPVTGSDQEAMVIVTDNATDDDLIPGGGMLFTGYDNVVVVDRINDSLVAPTTETLRNQIEFSADNPNPFLRVERMFTVTNVMELPGDDADVDILGIVTNVSDTVQCGIQITLDEVTFTDGLTINPVRVLISAARVRGALGNTILSSDPFEDCLLPATSAYFYFEDPRLAEDIENVIQPTNGDIQSVVLGTFRSVSRNNLDFETGIINITLTRGQFGDEIVLQNTGNFDIELERVTVYPLDSTGLPVSLNEVGGFPDDSIAPGETVLLTNTSLFGNFSSSVERLIFNIVYNDI